MLNIGTPQHATGTTTASVTLDSSLKAGDLIIVGVAYDTGSVTTAAQLPDYLLQSTANGSGSTVTLQTYAKIANGSEAGSTLTVTPSGGGSGAICLMATIYRGRFIDATDAFTHSTDVAQDTSNTAITGNVVSAFAAGSRILSFAAAVTAGLTATCAVTGTNWNKIIDVDEHAVGVDMLLSVAENIADTTPAHQPTFTWSATSGHRVCSSYAIVESLYVPVRNPTVWMPFQPTLPTKYTNLPLDQVRANEFAVNLDAIVTRETKAPSGWGYTNSKTLSEASPGTAAAPARKYWFTGTGNSKMWVKADITYDGSGNITEMVWSFSSDNQTTYTPMKDQFGNYVATMTYDGSSNLQSIAWGNTP